MQEAELNRNLADAILGVDTLWGGDVMSPSGMGRFIADSWCSDQPLPDAYTHDHAKALREAGGVSAKEPDHELVDRYIEAVPIRDAIAGVVAAGNQLTGSRGVFISGLGTCLEVMWDLVMEIVERGDPVPYERCVQASTAAPPSPSEPQPKRRQLAALLEAAGHTADSDQALLDAVDAWRKERMVPAKSLPALASAFIAELDALTAKNLLPYLPSYLHEVPRQNVVFLPIENAWFSGSMNYIGRARTATGQPEYEATYEINATLEISIPEFQSLVSHEVVPGHVTTFAYLQHLYETSRAGFEATILTMNSRLSTLAEGIANNAALIAYGLTEVEELPDQDLQIGILLCELQDDAKNQASYLTYKEQVAQPEVARTLRQSFLVSEERAEKLSGAWARHPLLGRMYLPAYRAGTELVAKLRREHPPEKVLPALYGCSGPVDIATICDLLA